MGIRLRLVLALLAVALAPLAFLYFRIAPALAPVRDAAAAAQRERVERAAASVVEPLAAFHSRVSAWRNAIGTEGFGALAPPDGRPRRRDERRIDEAARRVTQLAREQGLERFMLQRPPGETLLAEPLAGPPSVPAGVTAWPEGQAVWRWDEGGRWLRLIAVARWPPGRGGEPEAILIGERLVEPLALQDEIAAVAGVPVELARGAAARTAAPGREFRLALRGPRGETVATLTAPLGDAAAALDTSLRGALRDAVVAGIVLAVALALVVGALLAAPLRALTRAVAAVTSPDHTRLTMPRGPGEIGSLGAAIDGMLVALRHEQRRRAAAERLAAWQEIARRVAHEVKNPLTPIRLAVGNLRRAAARGSDPLADVLPDEAAAIEQEIARLERLVSEFSSYARLPMPALAPLAIGPFVREVAERHAGDGLALRVAAGDGLPRVAADADLLAMALANLLRNAREAIGEGGGAVRVSVSSSADRRAVEIVLDDDGPGIPHELLDRLFEPYVSGRGDGGRGLGLSIVRRIVEDHGGTVRAENRREGGARFVVTLPAEGD